MYGYTATSTAELGWLVRIYVDPKTDVLVSSFRRTLAPAAIYGTYRPVM